MAKEKDFLVIIEQTEPNDGYTLIKESQVDTYLRYVLEELHVRAKNIRLFEVKEYDIKIERTSVHERI